MPASNRLRVVLYASGSPASLTAFDAIEKVASVTDVVVPRARGVRAALTRHFRLRALRSHARARGLTIHEFRKDSPPPAADLLCVASFPHLIPADHVARAPLGAINIHPSLLPRHRGPDPLFWTYFDDDRTAGVTVHAIGKGVDDGDVLAQEEMPLPRGLRGFDLYFQLTNVGARLAASVVEQFERGTVIRTPQDESRATVDPPPSERSWSIDYATWPAERLWHFLRGVDHRDGFTIADRDGKHHPIGNVLAYRNDDHGKPPGTIERRTLFARDGSVTWSPAPLRRVVRNVLRPTPNRRTAEEAAR